MVTKASDKPSKNSHSQPDKRPVLGQPLQGYDVKLPGGAVCQQGPDLHKETKSSENGR